MSHRAVRNFNIGRVHVSVGQAYHGSGVEELLRLGLVEKVEDSQPDPQADAPSASAEQEPEPEPAKAKGKRRKG